MCVVFSGIGPQTVMFNGKVLRLTGNRNDRVQGGWVVQKSGGDGF